MRSHIVLLASPSIDGAAEAQEGDRDDADKHELHHLLMYSRKKTTTTGFEKHKRETSGGRSRREEQSEDSAHSSIGDGVADAVMWRAVSCVIVAYDSCTLSSGGLSCEQILRANIFFRVPYPRNAKMRVWFSYCQHFIGVFRTPDSQRNTHYSYAARNTPQQS